MIASVKNIGGFIHKSGCGMWGVTLNSIGKTFNQKSTADAVTSLGTGNIIFDAVSSLPNAFAIQHAMNDLSGEIYATSLGVFVEESRYLREAVLNRVQNSFAANDFSNLNSPNSIQPTTSKLAFWGQGFGAWGNLHGNNNTAEVDRSTKGIFLGADALFGESIRIGVVTGYSNSHFDVDARNSSVESDNYHLGLYTGTKLDHVGIRLGGAYTWQNADTKRAFSVPGLNNHLSSSNVAHTGQVFAEIGYETQLNQLALEPIGRAAYVNVDRSTLRESGGAAGLKGSGSYDVPYTTLGLRETSTIGQSSGFYISESALIGWNHAYNNTTPESTLAFNSGSVPFIIQGAPIAKDSLLIDAGLNFIMPEKNMSFRIAYNGQWGNLVKDNGVVGVLSWKMA